MSQSAQAGNSKRANQKVCFIAGAGHSGSTLLGFILGSHSDAFYCGEAAKTRFLGDRTKKLAKRVCKLCGEACPIWGSFQPDPAIDLYEQMSQKVGCSVIIDSAKNVDWIQQQIADLTSTPAQLFLIFLQRDGRAVLNSRIRKYPQKAAQTLIEEWQQQIQATRRLFDDFSQQKIKIHYEELASNPQLVTQHLCHFLQIDYQPQMLQYTQQEHHVLGGNNGTQFLVAKAQRDRLTQPFVTLSERNRTHYENHSAAIVLDLRWRQELPPDLQALFEQTAGQDNHELRWDACNEKN